MWYKSFPKPAQRKRMRIVFILTSCVIIFLWSVMLFLYFENKRDEKWLKEFHEKQADFDAEIAEMFQRIEKERQKSSKNP